ncbi:MAG: hypothetical protein KC435_05815 [Thermomicrobiales bacterium]|nr:hypothetical protein [Thermomicrobiales bacterium]
MNETHTLPSTLRVSVACFRWNGAALETIVQTDGTLPSTLSERDESLDTTATRILGDIFPEPAAYVEQLYTFSHVHCDIRETLVTYIALFAPDVRGSVEWCKPNGLALRDATVLDYAVVRLRAKLEYTSIVFHLMPPVFTIAELQSAYEAILDERLDKRNFRRRMTTSGMLIETGEKRREGPHRPAALYRFSGRADRSSYLTPVSIISEETPA